jgi:transposase InsO family protein
VLLCEAMQTSREELALTGFERLFAERGLPLAIRSDNGVPFASPNGLFNLSKPSVWWLRLGIQIERIKAGTAQQNGRHERMHLTLKREATRPPEAAGAAAERSRCHGRPSTEIKAPSLRCGVKARTESVQNASAPLFNCRR